MHLTPILTTFALKFRYELQVSIPLPPFAALHINNNGSTIGMSRITINQSHQREHTSPCSICSCTIQSFFYKTISQMVIILQCERVTYKA
jgi:hypothetical protein